MRDPKRRFENIWRMSKPRTICEADVPNDEMDPSGPSKDPKKPGHGGCGNIQPTIRRNGLKLTGSYKVPKGEEDEDNKQPETKTITPQMALNVFKRITQEDAFRLGLSYDYARPEW